MLGKFVEPHFSGNSAYRALIKRSEFANDPKLAPLFDITNQTTYVWYIPLSPVSFSVYEKLSMLCY
jgi:hypothetical protein